MAAGNNCKITLLVNRSTSIVKLVALNQGNSSNKSLTKIAIEDMTKKGISDIKASRKDRKKRELAKLRTNLLTQARVPITSTMLTE